MDNSDIRKIVRDYEEKVAAGISFYMDATDMMDVAEYYIKANRYADADNCIAIALRLHPLNEEVLLMKAYRLKDENRWQEAMRLVQSLSEQSNRDVQLFYVEALLSEMRFEAAEKRFYAIVDGLQPPELYDWYVDYAEILLDYGFYLRAARWLEGFPATDGSYDMKHVYELRGEAWFQLRVYDRAIANYNCMIDASPFDEQAWIMLADAQYRAEEYEDAIASCDYALANDENAARAYQLKLYAALQAERPEVAIDAGREFLKRCPEDYTGYMILGEVMSVLEDYRQAAELFRQAVRYCPENQPDRHIIYSHLADSLMHLRRYADALDALLCYPAEDSKLWGLFYRVAETAVINGDVSEAAAILHQAVQLVLPTVRETEEAVRHLFSHEYADAARSFFGDVLSRVLESAGTKVVEYYLEVGKRYGFR
ncbi:MAG: tetratricopeptide repeat protein [Alloprevotella sp.]|nr:tetratricopeptide repeat protein [Alloprevotella sp.]